MFEYGEGACPKTEVDLRGINTTFFQNLPLALPDRCQGDGWLSWYFKDLIIELLVALEMSIIITGNWDGLLWLPTSEEY